MRLLTVLPHADGRQRPDERRASGRTHIGARLDLILEDGATDVPDDPYQAAMALAAELDEARRKVSELERRWMYAVDRLCGGLAMGVRKHHPSLNVGIDGGKCKVGYRSKHLLMAPDMVKKVWTVDSPDPRFARRFMRAHGPRTSLGSDMMPIAQAIADFFVGHYRTLGEEVEGRGLTIIDGKFSTIGDLACFIKDKERLLTEVAAG